MNAKKLKEPRAFHEPPTQRGKERWRKVVETADRMFEELGYNNVSLAEVVREAGGSLSTIYQWFGSKDELFLCVICDRLSGLSEAIDSIVLRGPTVQDDIETLVETIAANSHFKLVRYALIDIHMFDAYQTKLLEVIEQNTNVPIAALFSRIRKERAVQFNASDVELALVFVRFFRGLCFELALYDEDMKERMTQGKQMLVTIFTSLIQSPEGARQ
ncbi:MAG: TetR/AcrR family transcriptional regulator [Thermoguttaceae bacterium]|nr:TetR/AcrR family transcriptional regulator [Thermoguttaceae bacterium]